MQRTCLATLTGLTRLTTLRLDSATVIHAGVQSLQSLKQLRTLNLYHTLVTETDCRIVRERESSLPARRRS
jgi:hypothetical protein